MTERLCMKVLTARDRRVPEASGYGGGMGCGQRPALRIIDVNDNFTGERAQPILESIRRWRNSCGEEAWVAIQVIRGISFPAFPSRLGPRRIGWARCSRQAGAGGGSPLGVGRGFGMGSSCGRAVVQQLGQHGVAGRMCGVKGDDLKAERGNFRTPDLA